MKTLVQKIARFAQKSVISATTLGLVVGIAVAYPLSAMADLTLWYLDGTTLRPVDSTWTVSVTGTPAGSDTQVQFNDGGSLGGDSGFVYNKTTNHATFQYASSTSLTATSSAFFATANGSVGIGTTSPSAKLHIDGGNALTRLRIDADTGQAKILSFATDNSARWALRVQGTTESGSNVGSDLDIRAYDDSGSLLSTPMSFIRSSGFVGISTTSPYALLSVGGNVVIGASTAGGTLGDLYLPKLGTAAGTFIAVDPTGKVIATTTAAGGVTSVTGTYPVVSSGGATPAISLAFGTTTSNTWGGTQTMGALTVTGNTTLATTLSGLLGLNTGVTYAVSTSTLSIGGNAGTATALQTARTINGISFDGTANITIASTTLLADSNTFSGTKNTITSASTTNLTVGTTLVVPTGASQAPTRSGDTTVDTTDNQLKIGTGTGTAVHDQRRMYSFGEVGTTTAQTITGTTTITAAPFPRTGVTVDSLYCTVAPAGATVDVLWQYGPVPTQIVYVKGASSTPGIYTFSSSNTPGANASSTVTIGTPSGSPTSVGCTAEARITGT